MTPSFSAFFVCFGYPLLEPTNVEICQADFAWQSIAFCSVMTHFVAFCWAALISFSSAALLCNPSFKAFPCTFEPPRGKIKFRCFSASIVHGPA
jgi:hypothetical protein